MLHGSVRLLGTGVEPKDISGTGSADRLGRKTPEETGGDTNVPRDRVSGVLFSAVDFREGVYVRVEGDGLSRTSVDDSDVVFPKRRYMVGVGGSVAYRRGGGDSVRLSGEGLVPASVEAARPGVAGLDFFEE